MLASINVERISASKNLTQREPDVVVVRNKGVSTFAPSSSLSASFDVARSFRVPTALKPVFGPSLAHQSAPRQRLEGAGR